MDAYTGWLKKASCCTVSTAYFFGPPCTCIIPDNFLNNRSKDINDMLYNFVLASC